MSIEEPTASEIRAANRNAVGGGRKRCTRGKNCSATCIDGGKWCLVGLPEPTSKATGKLANFLKGILGEDRSKSAPPGSPPQKAPKVANPTPSSQPPEKVKIMPEGERATLYGERQLNVKLNDRHRDSLSDYSLAEGKNSYKVINGFLRDPSKSPGDNTRRMKDLVENIDKALDRLPKNKEYQPFWRGVDASSPSGQAFYKYLETAQPGTKISDKAFSSYSFKEDVARTFLGNSQSILFVSRNPNLTPINEFSEFRKEGEALLPRGLEQTIQSVTKNGETLIVELY